MATLVGQTAWQQLDYGDNIALPAGIQAGDVIVTYSIGGQPSGGAANTVFPWLRAASMTVPALFGWPITYGAFWRIRKADDVNPKMTPWGFLTVQGGYAKVVAWRGTRGVGTVRINSLAVPAQANGAAMFMHWGNDAPSGITWLGDSPFPPGAAKFRAGWLNGGATSTTLGPSTSNPTGIAIELLPPAGPLVNLSSPTSGDISNSGLTEFTWAYTPAAGTDQDAWELRVNGQYYNNSSSTFQGGVVSNPGNLTSIGISLDGFATNTTVPAEVRARESGTGLWSSWSTVNITPVPPPSINLTGPTVTVNNDLTPTATWTRSTPRGVQTAYELRLTRLGVVVYRSGVLPGNNTSFTFPANLGWIHGGTYRLEARVQQTGGSWSSWGQRDFTMTWTQPALPTITVGPKYSPWGELWVNVSGPAGLGVEIERLNPDGQWVSILPIDSNMPVSGLLSFMDPFAPYGTPTRYRARHANELEGVPLTGEWQLNDAPVTSYFRSTVIAAARDPLRTYVIAPTRDRGNLMLNQSAEAHYGIGAKDPFTMYGDHQGYVGELTVLMSDQITRANLLALITSNEELLIKGVAEEKLGLHTRVNDEAKTVVRDGQPTMADPMDRLTEARDFSFTYRTTSAVPLTGSRAPILHNL